MYRDQKGDEVGLTPTVWEERAAVDVPSCCARVLQLPSLLLRHIPYPEQAGPLPVADAVVVGCVRRFSPLKSRRGQ